MLPLLWSLGFGCADPARPAPVIEAPTSAPDLQWALIAVPPTLSMAERSTFRLQRQVTNTGDTVANPDAASGSFTINGAPARDLDMAFGNGLRDARWAELPPGETVSDGRGMGEQLFPAPGDYTITMTVGDAAAAVTVTVTP